MKSFVVELDIATGIRSAKFYVYANSEQEAEAMVYAWVNGCYTDNCQWLIPNGTTTREATKKEALSTAFWD